MKNRCESQPASTPLKGSEWNGWGFDARQLALPDVAGPDRRRRAEAGAQVGVRFSRRQLRLRPADGRRRPRLRRRRHRFRLFARRGERLHPLVVPRRRRRSHRAQRSVRRHRRIASWPTSATSRPTSTPSMPRPARRYGGTASTRIRSRASPARRHWSTAASTCRCRRSRNRAPATRAIPAARFAAASTSYDAQTRQAPLDVVHHRRAADAAEEDVEGHAALGTGGRRRVVVADDRSEAARGLCRDRQRLHRAGGARIRRGDRVRSRQRQAALGQAGDGRTTPTCATAPANTVRWCRRTTSRRPAPTISAPTWISATRRSCARCPTAGR